VCPALVWGKGSGPDKVTSIMIPDTVKKSLHNGKATYTGKGTNTWVHISIDDVSNLIVDLTQDRLKNPFAVGKTAMFNNFYFGSHPDLVSFKHIAEVMGKALQERGKVDSAETMSVPAPKVEDGAKGVRIEDDKRSKEDAEVDAKTPLWPCRTNCRCIAKRGSDELGWKATKQYDDEAIRQDVFIALDSM
jgi:nucleoside-diphosphate-sugar epimerase